MEETLILEDKRNIHTKMITDFKGIKLMNKEVLSNGYIRCIDMDLTVYNIAPSCLKYSTDEWIGAVADKEVFVYLKNGDYTEDKVTFLNY